MSYDTWKTQAPAPAPANDDAYRIAEEEAWEAYNDAADFKSLAESFGDTAEDPWIVSERAFARACFAMGLEP